MANFIIFLDRLVNLYLYFVIGACLLSWVPNINPDYPLFNYIFKAAGFYILPPVMGISFAPALVMVVAALVSIGLRKVYLKYYADKEPKIVVLTQEEFLEKLKEKENRKEEKKDDCN